MAQAKYNVWWAAGYNTVAISFAMGAFEKVGLKANAYVSFAELDGKCADTDADQSRVR